MHKISGLVFGRVSPASVGPELNGPNQQTRCSVQHRGLSAPPSPSALRLYLQSTSLLVGSSLDTGQAGICPWNQGLALAPLVRVLVPPACSQLLLPRPRP